MQKTILNIAIVILLGACTSNTIYQKPEDLIPKEQMIELLTDIYLANAAVTNPNKLEKRNIFYLPLVYKKYNIDSAQFKRSNHYYTSRIKDYKSIYQAVFNNLEKLQEEYKIPAKIYDSINKLKLDSLKRLKRLLKKRRPVKN